MDVRPLMTTTKSKLAAEYGVDRRWIPLLICEHDLEVIEEGNRHLLPPATVDRLAPILERIGRPKPFASGN